MLFDNHVINQFMFFLFITFCLKINYCEVLTILSIFISYEANNKSMF